MSLVSVVIGTYGDERWRDAGARAAASARPQAREVIQNHEYDGTLATARNNGALAATGDWLCFLDADDELCPGYVTEMRATMRHWNLARRGDLIYNPLLLAPAVEYCEGMRGEPAIPNAGRWPDVNECVIGTLVPRHLFNQVGGFRELPSLEDFDLWLRCVKAGARIVHVPDAIYCAHYRAGGRNSDQSVYDQLRAEHHEVWER